MKDESLVATMMSALGIRAPDPSRTMPVRVWCSGDWADTDETAMASAIEITQKVNERKTWSLRENEISLNSG